MWISRRALVALLVAGVGATSMVLAAGALGTPGSEHGKDATHDGRQIGPALIDESFAPSMPTDPTFHAVAPGSLPWVLRSGRVRLRRDGRFDLTVIGLVIPTPPFTGTPGPVTTISASLYCGADSDPTPAGTTQQVPLSRRGDARIRDASFSVPSTCLAPVILIHPNGLMNNYIAVDGWRVQ